MNSRLVLGSLTTLSLVAGPAWTSAATPAGMVPGNGSATFRFATAVQTPKGTHSGSGTLTLKRTGDRSASVTVQTDDGSPPRTIPLIIGVDGSVAPDPSSASPSPDAATNGQASALFSQMTIAAHVGIGARKNAGGERFDVPVKLTPVGAGTDVAATLGMSGTATQYEGQTQGHTMTQLPQGGGLDPQEIVKTAGVAAVAHGFTPAGRAATAIVMHRRRKQAKKEAGGPLPDDMTLTVTASLAAGRVHEIKGSQTDKITLEGKPVDIQSTWSFTRTT